jgi:hypothetical protein
MGLHRHRALDADRLVGRVETGDVALDHRARTPAPVRRLGRVPESVGQPAAFE